MQITAALPESDRMVGQGQVTPDNVRTIAYRHGSA